MSSTTSPSPVRPRIILHGGAGNISRETVPPARYAAFRSSLLHVLSSASDLLRQEGATAIDVATHAVSLLEDDPLFNAGKGAVFTRAGTNELEASIMVSNGKRKRGVGCMMLRHVKNPIKLAREMLLRGEDLDGGGAFAHVQLSGEYLENLARVWDLEMVEPSYFFTKKRWDEHMRGIQREKDAEPSIAEVYGNALGDDPSWDGKEYLPQGTVGAVVLDGFGTICVATSTGGLTNKLPGRIGDTPTLGAGFWAEEWFEKGPRHQMLYQAPVSPAASAMDKISRGDLTSLLGDCLPSKANDISTSHFSISEKSPANQALPPPRRHAVGMSGTGNGDSFLRVAAVRTAAAISRFSTPNVPLATAVSRIAGPGGELQRSAGDRFGKTGEGEGGIIGIEFVGTKGKVVSDFNCGGMFRAWIDDEGEKRFMVFRDE